jgi:hypothetical protein
MVDLEPKSKFSFIAEVLPQNERTREIMAAREAKENQKRAEEEEVRVYSHLDPYFPLSI